MNREILDKWCERGILGSVLIILVFGPLATGAVRTPDLLVIQALTVVVMLLWGFRLWLKPRPQLLWPPICWAVIAFTLYVIGRYLFSEIEYVARQDMIRVVIYCFLFFVIINNLHRQEHIQIIMLTLVFLAMMISFYAIYQFASGTDKVWTFVKPAVYKGRGSGTYISPNNLAGFLEMILPLALAWTLVSRLKHVVKIFIGYAALAVLAGIAVTLSRGSWISVGLVLLGFFGLLLFHRTYRLPSAVLLVLLLAGGLYFVPRTGFFQARIKQVTANDRFNDSARFELWMPAVRLWKENVWFGIGPNHYNYRFRAYRPQSEQRQPDRVHNDYLNTVTDLGVVGVLVAASAWTLLGIGAFKTWRYVRGTSGDLGGGNSNKFAIVLGASLGLVGILLHSVVDFNMHIPANAIVAVFLMAILSASLRFATDRYWFAARTFVRISLSIILVTGVVYLSWQGIRRTKEYVSLEHAREAVEFSPAQIETLEKAFAIEPMNFETAYRIGEGFRTQSWEGNEGNELLATNAMTWFQRCTTLNPYDGYGFMRYGMCLDWLDRHSEARPYFDRAVTLDPNGYFTVAHMGWHY